MRAIPGLPLRTLSKYASRFLSASFHSGSHISLLLMQLSSFEGHLASSLIIKEELPELARLSLLDLFHKTPIPVGPYSQKPEYLSQVFGLICHRPIYNH